MVSAVAEVEQSFGVDRRPGGECLDDGMIEFGRRRSGPGVRLLRSGQVDGSRRCSLDPSGPMSTPAA